jgi:serine/threonine protein kinase
VECNISLPKESFTGLEIQNSQLTFHRDLALRNILISFVDGGFLAKISGKPSLSTILNVDFGLSRFMGAYDIYQASSKGPLPVKWFEENEMKLNI